jgi:anti-sigma-K factor RskA
MTRDELEFLISQCADGTLEAEHAAALEDRLARDEEARAMLAEHQRLNEIVRNGAALPPINWDRLAGAISANIDAADAVEAAPQRDRMRIPVGRWIVQTAAVAALLAVGIFIRVSSRNPDEPVGGWTRGTVARVIEVSVPSATDALAASTRQQPEVQVAIAPPDSESIDIASELASQDFLAIDMRILVAAGAQRRSAEDPFDGY